MPEIYKQRIPHPKEVSLKDSRTKTSIASLRSAKKYKLKGLNLAAKE